MSHLQSQQRTHCTSRLKCQLSQIFDCMFLIERQSLISLQQRRYSWETWRCTWVSASKDTVAYIKWITVQQFQTGMFIILEPKSVLYIVVVEEIFLEDSTARNRSIYVIYKACIDQRLHKRVCQIEENHSGAKLLILTYLWKRHFFPLVYIINMMFCSWDSVGNVAGSPQNTPTRHVQSVMQGFLTISTAPASAAASCYAVLSKSISGCSKEENTHLNTDFTTHSSRGYSILTEDTAKGRDWFYYTL